MEPLLFAPDGAAIVQTLPLGTSRLFSTEFLQTVGGSFVLGFWGTPGSHRHAAYEYNAHRSPVKNGYG
jgi:hypothetical protein